MMQRQLLFEFAETPPGGEEPNPSSELVGRNFLRLKSKARNTNSISTVAAESGRLLEEIASEDNLSKALLHVASNKGAAGVDGRSVEEIVAKAPTLLPLLRRRLLEGRYRPMEVKRVWIPKPGGGEPRGLGVPTTIDRWVQQAIHQVLASLFEPTFHDSSHGFRPGRGAHMAVTEAKALVEAGYEWVVSIDLSKFFDRVNHQRLLARLGQKVADGRVLRLIRMMLKARVVLPDGARVLVEEGTPQGGPLSPLLSNIVLDELDWELERRGLCFKRYADDLNVFVRSERAGARVMEGLTRFIERRLRLQVNREKTVVDKPENVHILGFSIRKDGRTGQTDIQLSRKTVSRLRNKTRELTPRTWGQSLEECFRELNQYLDGWIGYFALCSESGAQVLKRVDAHTRRRIRAIIITQHKKPRFLFRHLVKRGGSRKEARQCAYSSSGIWCRSFKPGITKAYRNNWFAERLTSLWTMWRYKNTRMETVPSQQLLLEL